MLSIGAMAGGQEAYYTELAREDYYLEGGEPPGTWWRSQGGAAIGLFGQVKRDMLGNVFRGFSPDGKRPLVRNAGREDRRAGFDLTFSAPKSVSVLFALAPSLRVRVQGIHARAVEKALGYLEDKATFTRRGAGGEKQIRASLVAALFEHSTARATGGSSPDPHLHTHCLVMNLGLAEDGSSGTLDGRHLYRHKMAAGALYRAELFALLEEELGLLSSKKDRIAELDIIPETLRTEFSKRRVEILTYLEERGLSGAKEASDAALETRGAKPEVDRKALYAEWRARAEALGFELDADTLAAASKTVERDVFSLTREAIGVALGRITERESHFAERDLVRFVAEDVEGRGVGALAVRLAVEEFLRSSPDIVALAEVSGEKRFTTKEMLELERAILSGAGRLRGLEHVVSGERLKAVLETRASIRDEQRAALEHITSGGSIALVSGMAGTGKTFMLAAAREAWEAEGLTVRGAALSAAAAKRLEAGSGTQSTTIHRLLWEEEQGQLTLGPKTVLVIDEAGMVGTRQMARLVALAESAGAKLVLVGDERQLQAIDAGGPFAALVKGLGAARLTEIRRQKEGWARDAVFEIAGGEASRALSRFQERGLFFVGKDRKDAVRQLVSDWTRIASGQELKDTLVLTGTRLGATQVNRAIQGARWERGELGSARVQVGGDSLHVGDRILFRRNAALVSNGDGGVVVELSEQDRTLTAKLDGGRRVTMDLDAYSHIQLGYAATTHVAQGATIANCLVLVGGSTQDREAAYVQASRATDETRLYTDAATAGEELHDLVREMERSRRKGLAVDLAEQELALELEHA